METHCYDGHRNRESRDAHGTWCLDCGQATHSGPRKGCKLCAAIDKAQRAHERRCGGAASLRVKP